MAAAILVAALAGCMGCLVAGTVGLLAMGGGLAVGAAPVAWLRRA